jgi:hypothetical protein
VIVGFASFVALAPFVGLVSFVAGFALLVAALCLQADFELTPEALAQSSRRVPS